MTGIIIVEVTLESKAKPNNMPANKYINQGRCDEPAIIVNATANAAQPACKLSIHSMPDTYVIIGSVAIPNNGIQNNGDNADNVKP